MFTSYLAELENCTHHVMRPRCGPEASQTFISTFMKVEIPTAYLVTHCEKDSPGGAVRLISCVNVFVIVAFVVKLLVTHW